MLAPNWLKEGTKQNITPFYELWKEKYIQTHWMIEMEE